MSATAFQRMRRELTAKKEREANVLPDEKNPTEGQNEPQNDTPTDEQRPLSPDDIEGTDIDGMDIEKVKEFLDQMEIKFAHNTGEEKLREKLKNAIG